MIVLARIGDPAKFHHINVDFSLQGHGAGAHGAVTIGLCPMRLWQMIVLARIGDPAKFHHIRAINVDFSLQGHGAGAHGAVPIGPFPLGWDL